ncbi:MAG: hypothetical protein NTX24_05210 [Candidatus Pacearchaeota archaeon]|nr:hypothetical protein [Candidatus Pacearchaeota archaeon]
MKHKIILLSSSILILLVILSFNLAIPTASADSFLDWITGKATKLTNVSITIAQIRIDWVSAIANPQNVTESGSTTVVFYFNASVPGGTVSNINKSSAAGNFSLAGETTRQNDSCLNVSEGTDWVNFSCSIKVWYWDGAGNWTVTAFVKDNSSNSVTNTSTNMTLSQSTCFVTSPNELTWATAIPGSVNQVSNNDPSLLNNTCNDDVDTDKVDVKALDLVGATNNSFSIFAEDFKSSVTSGSECSGVALQNNTFKAITGSILPSGNNSLNYGNGTSGQEQLYYCIPAVNSSLIAQAYSTTKLGSWTIQIS